jgi:hypothetical protein
MSPERATSSIHKKKQLFLGRSRVGELSKLITYTTTQLRLVWYFNLNITFTAVQQIMLAKKEFLDDVIVVW